MLRLLLLLTLSAAAAAQEDDVRCLRGVKSALTDASGSLSNWDFANTTVGSVCFFTGVSCWNPQENRVLGLSLSSLSLSGAIPSALQFCHNTNNLDLSNNLLSGPIPLNICSWLPYLVTLDLSNNNLLGPIPPDLGSCQYLNSLVLSSNQLSGAIPASLTRLSRLHRIDVSNNRLSGPIPPGLAGFDPDSFAGNSLCGRPLSSCGGRKSKSLIIILAAGIFGALGSMVLAYVVYRWCCLKPVAGAAVAAPAPAPAGWVERLRVHRMVPVQLFQKPIVKVKLNDLLTATFDFSPDRVVAFGSARTGVSYCAVLPDGSALTVKRLRPCALPEKQFRAEMARVGQLRHPNLVPLLGFCSVEDERLLIYKHMPNGALSAVIRTLDWASRYRIAVGAARGVAWLHHGFQPPVLHQTFSSTSVLLDEDYEARITDFGLASLASSVASAVGDFGEFGYVAPEYATNPIPTTKGDVYALGVVLLELATGQKPAEVTSEVVGEVFKGNLVDWVNQLNAGGRLRDGIDRSLRGRGNDDKIVQFLTVACGCVNARPKDRPSMSQIYDSLKSIGDDHDSSEQFDEFPLIYGKDDPAPAPM